MLEEAERRSSKRIEPGRTPTCCRYERNANSGIEAQQVSACAADIDRTFDPHRCRTYLVSVRDADFVGELLSDGEGQSDLLERRLAAGTDP